MEAKAAFNVDEAAQLIGVGRSTLYLEIKAERLKVRKLGSRTLILREDLEAFLSNLPSSSDK
jgi:excisionase family DNA binding protein